MHDKLKNDNRKMYIFAALLLCLFLVISFIAFEPLIFATDNSNREKNKENKNIYKNLNPIDLEKIIEQNINKNVKEEMIVEEIDLEYKTQYKSNSDLPSGTMQVIEEGRTGKQNAIIIKKYENDELISEEQVTENILKSPIDRIVEVGTGSSYNSYTISEGDNAYVTANSVAIRLEANENSDKICTLNKNDSAKILKIIDDWTYISTSEEIKGYAKKDCFTGKNPKSNAINDESTYSKQQLLAKLNINMDLRNKSGLSLDQFRKVLSNDQNDKNNVLKNNAEYFYYVEKQYGINGIFVAAIAIHESGWGTSTIAQNKKNLFGYGAIDSNPYGGAYNFETYNEGIDLVSRVLVKYYLNPNGTKIYDGETATGKFYSGSNVSAVGSRYASDKNWPNSVYKWMEYLYNKI